MLTCCQCRPWILTTVHVQFRLISSATYSPSSIGAKASKPTEEANFLRASPTKLAESEYPFGRHLAPRRAFRIWTKASEINRGKLPRQTESLSSIPWGNPLSVYACEERTLSPYRPSLVYVGPVPLGASHECIPVGTFLGLYSRTCISSRLGFFFLSFERFPFEGH